MLTLISIAFLLAVTATVARAARPAARLVAGALCVHDGWIYTTHRPRSGVRPRYLLWHHGYWRLYKTWSNGEGPWDATSNPAYGGGLSFMVGTWNRAGAPYAHSTADIAAASPAEQIRRLLFIVRQDHGSWREWPNTARACGLPVGA